MIRHYLDCTMLPGSFAKARTYQQAQFKYVPSLYMSWTSTRGLRKRQQHAFHKDACTGKRVFHTLCLGQEKADGLHSAPAAQRCYRAEHRRPTAGTTVPTPAGKGAWGWARCLISYKDTKIYSDVSPGHWELVIPASVFFCHFTEKGRQVGSDLGSVPLAA